MRTETLEARISRLEAIEEIKQLKARYCAYCDRGYDADAIAELFVADAVWDGGRKRGRQAGRQAIRAFFKGISERITFAGHLVVNPIIEVTGDTAVGRWRMLMPYMSREAGPETARWQLADYEDGFVRAEGRWMFKHLKVALTALDPTSGRWVEV
jgi:ketosteroid isomerase-like protein